MPREIAGQSVLTSIYAALLRLDCEERRPAVISVTFDFLLFAEPRELVARLLLRAEVERVERDIAERAPERLLRDLAAVERPRVDRRRDVLLADLLRVFADDERERAEEPLFRAVLLAVLRVRVDAARARLRVPRLELRLDARLLLDPLAAARLVPRCERLCAAAAVLRLTSLLKLLFCPPAVSSCTRRASPLFSNLSNHSSHETSSRESPPLYPGKSRRMTPGSLPRSVARTAAGLALRSSAQRRISSRSVRALVLLAIP
jgi:hypothetical protein